MLNWLKTFNKYGRGLFNKPSYVFHHIPKCGGSSIRSALKTWFNTVEDNRNPAWSREQLHDSKIAISALKRNSCLVGHFDVPIFYLKDRYPNILTDDNFFLFTFLRDPLEVKMSLFYYELRMKRKLNYSLEERLVGSTNYIANRFPCDESNFRKVLDRYNFIGIAERSQESMNQLAVLLNKPRVTLSWKNESKREVSTKELPLSLVNKFKDLNRIDYQIYDYCLNKFLKQ